jgi:adenosine kinase
MTIVCSASLAIDRLAEYPGLFRDSIIPEKLHLLNVCFMVDTVKKTHGGTAGNISYNLHLLGERPLVAATVGDDADGREYLERLRSWDLDTAAVKPVPELPTAGAYIATDKSGSQLSFFHPGAMTASSRFDPQALEGGPPSSHLAIVSPGCREEMLGLPKAYRRLGLPFVFDPGQQIPIFSKEELLDMLDGAALLTTNEYELDLFLKITGLKIDDLFGYAPAIVTTLSSQGSRISTPRGSQHILPASPERVGNPTGAGDGYRAGVLKALSHGESLLSACRLGSTVASFCIEGDGTQDHSFSLGQVLSRHYRTFKETPNCL